MTIDPQKLDEQLDRHVKTVTAAMTDGELVIVLGAGANLCGRPESQDKKTWQPAGEYLPSGSELAEYLAEQSEFPTYEEKDVECPHCHQSHKVRYPVNDMRDLLRVSQHIAVLRGEAPLYKQLHRIFNADYAPTRLHRFLATLPAVLRKKGYPPHQLIVTTNYDDVLERAFCDAGEAFDLVHYNAGGTNLGKFTHSIFEPPRAEPVAGGTENQQGGRQGRQLIQRPWKVETHLIEDSNNDLSASLEHRSVILKIHGAVARAGAEESNVVITEDDYIKYLMQPDISHLLPVKLWGKLRNSSFLFLGYSLRDWNLRVILYRIWKDQRLSYTSWAIQLRPEDFDQDFWQQYRVKIINQELESYVTLLDQRLQALPPSGDRQ